MLAAEKKLELIHDHATMEKRCDLKPKQIVQWKQGFKNKSLPQYNEPAIVLEILNEPRYAKQQRSGSAYFFEALDVVLGILNEKNDFVLFHYDSRRFEPFPEASSHDLLHSHLLAHAQSKSEQASNLINRKKETNKIFRFLSRQPNEPRKPL